MKATTLLQLTVFLLLDTVLAADQQARRSVRRNLADADDDSSGGPNTLNLANLEEAFDNVKEPIGSAGFQKNPKIDGGGGVDDSDEDDEDEGLKTKKKKKTPLRGDTDDEAKTGIIDNDPSLEDSDKPEKDVELSTMMVTPTLWSRYPDGLACTLTNVATGSSDRATAAARIYIISNGETLADTGNFELKPMHTKDVAIGGLDDGGPIYCGKFVAIFEFT